ALGCAIFLFLLIRLRKQFKFILLYSAAALLPLLTFLAWPIKTIMANLLLFPFDNYRQINQVPIDTLFTSTIILILTGYFLRKEKNDKILLLLIIQFFLLLTTIPLPDYCHLLIAGFPIMALTGIIIENISNRKNSNYSKFTYYYIATITTLFILYPAIYFLSFDFKPFFQSNREFFIFIEKNCPGKYIYAGPFAPNIYFESQKLNATPYPWLITNHNTPEQFQAAQQYLINNKPSCAILTYPKSLKRFKHSQDNPVENYIRENYHLFYTEQSLYIYKIK
ncbi:MAG: hypothetical protein WCX80_00830, partial [Patescibacteria group bacterium]